MSIFPFGLTLNTEDLPSMRHVRAMFWSTGIEDGGKNCVLCMVMVGVERNNCSVAISNTTGRDG